MIQPKRIVDFDHLWQVVIGMDVAASEFFSEKDKTYDLNFKEDVRIAAFYYDLCYISIYR